MSDQFFGEARGFGDQCGQEHAFAAPQDEARFRFGQSYSASDQMQCPVQEPALTAASEPDCQSDQDEERDQGFDPDLCPEDREDASHNKTLGERGEEAAARYLERRGYNILARNWICPYGEADIVAQDKDEDALVFVEVKTRSNLDFGFPEEAVTPEKRSRYERIACSFLKEYPGADLTVRFDVIGLMVVDEHRALIKHHVNAFGIA